MTNMPHKINHSSTCDHMQKKINTRGGGRTLRSITSLSLLTLAAAFAPITSTFAYTELENGVPFINKPLTGPGSEGAEISIGDTTFDDVKVAITENTSGTQSRTTTALNVESEKTISVSGSFSVINTISFEGRFENQEIFEIPIQITFANNNNALYVQGGSTLTFDESTESVFIAALGDDTSIQPSAAISAKNTGNSTNGSNTATIQGQRVQIIGNLDVGNTEDSNPPPGSKNTINLTLSSADSFWYGDQVDADDNNTVNLTLNNGGEWIYFSESSIANLTLLDGGIVNLVDEEIE